MPEFNDLPVEILPLIIQHLVRKQDLSNACLVSKTFESFATPILYERVSIYAWHKDSKTKACLLILTLSSYPHLARHVKRLEMRVFPKITWFRTKQASLIEQALAAIKNCVNLHSCAWTRDGACTNDVLLQLAGCPHLRELEINGHHTWNYYPEVLYNFHDLERLRIIMPSKEVVGFLPQLFKKNTMSFRSLSLICKSTSLVTDEFFGLVASWLTQLEQFHLAGCPKVTQRGIIDIFKANAVGISDLSLEGLSPAFDARELGDFCRRHNSLRNLQSITLTFPFSGVSGSWLNDVQSLLWDAPLKSFSLYAVGGGRGESQELSESFVATFIDRHRERLKRFAIMRLRVSVRSLDYVCQISIIEELFVTLRRSELNLVGYFASKANHLRSLHVSYPSTVEPDNNGDTEEGDEFGATPFDSESAAAFSNPFPRRDELLEIVCQLGPTVMQFGVLTRVWQVQRKSIIKADGSIDIKVDLGNYEGQDIPEAFLIMRT